MNTSRQILTLQRPGEQRKVTSPAAGLKPALSGVKVTRSHPFRVERRRIPEPHRGPTETSPTSRDATSQRPSGGQKEIFS